MNFVAWVAPFLGAVAIEAAYWFGVREKLHHVKYRKLIRSPLYWVITGVMVVVGGFGSLVIAEGKLGPAALFIMGAAFPALIKQAASTAQLAGGSLHLGDDTQTSQLSDYLNPQAT